MQTLQNLVLLYAGLVLFNTLLATGLWTSQRIPIYRDLFVLWCATLASLVLQGLLVKNNFYIVLGFSSVFVVNLCLARLLGALAPVRIPWRESLLLFVLALCGSFAAFLIEAPFLGVALPVAMAVVFPLLAVVLALSKHAQVLSFSGKAFAATAAVFALHNLDFAFLRDKPDFATLGFTLAILIVFALSIFAPAVILEMTTRDKTLISSELHVATHIQRQLVPEHPALPGFEIACFMQPSEKVGGDYYDVYQDKEKMVITIGDVAGHGLPAGLVMLMAQSMIRATLQSMKPFSLCAFHKHINKALFENLERLGDARTMTLLTLTSEDGGFLWNYHGSHDNFYMYRHACKDVIELSADQFTGGLGLLENLEIDEKSYLPSFSLHANDILFLCTDGLTEGMNDHGIFFDAKGHFQTWCQNHAHNTPLEGCKKYLIDRFFASTQRVLQDDVSFLMMRTQKLITKEVSCDMPLV